MIKFYFHTTPNPMKVALMLEELQTPYELHVVDILKGEQHLPAYRAINPNGKVPALIDDEVRIFDSHAIMLYLAKEHHRFIPETNTDQAQMLSWLMLVATGLSPFSGQAAHFLHYAPEIIPYARNTYVKEVARHYTVLDQHLAHSRYLAGNEYSIADMALWGWGISAGYIFGEQGLKDYPNVLRLVDEISIRPAAIRVKALRDQLVVKTDVDEVAIRSLFPQNY